MNRHLDEHFFEADLPWFRTVADAVANNYCQFSSVVEQRFCKPSVVGSIPTTGSKFRRKALRKEGKKCSIVGNMWVVLLMLCGSE